MREIIQIMNIPQRQISAETVWYAILTGVRPRSIIFPIVLGVGVDTDHLFGSRFLLNELFRLGFSESYDKVVLYTQSVLQDETLSTISPPPAPTFTQWGADNVDHNVRTLDGSGTFHGMGIIAMSTLGSDIGREKRVLRRARMKVGERVPDKGIGIYYYYDPSSPALSTVKLAPMVSLLQCRTINRCCITHIYCGNRQGCSPALLSHQLPRHTACNLLCTGYLIFARFTWIYQ